MSNERKKRHKCIAIFVSHLGCPHDCAFCNQEKITGFEKSKYRSIEDIEFDIQKQLSTIDYKQNHVEIAFFGGSFTGLPYTYQTQLLETASKYINQFQLEGIRFSTRPDYISKDIITRLSPYPINTIELGVQSLNPVVLQLSKRGHTVEQVESAVQLLKGTTYKLGIQIMAGLPGETVESFNETVSKVIQLAPDFVRIYPTLVLQDTLLEEMYRANLYKPWTITETINNIASVIPYFNDAGIPIIRIGLQLSADLMQPGVIVDGPLAPNLRQLVETKYFQLQLTEVANSLLVEKVLINTTNVSNKTIFNNSHNKLDLKIIDIIINPADETSFRGENNSTLHWFFEKYNYKINIIKAPDQLRYKISLK